MDNNAKKQIDVKNIIEDLSNGLTRYKKDDFGNGSIEEKYNLTAAQVARIFKHKKLKGLKVKGKSRIKDDFELIDNITEQYEMESDLASMVTSEVDINELEEVDEEADVDVNQLN